MTTNEIVVKDLTSISEKELFKRLKVDVENGHKEADIPELQAKYGKNCLEEEEKESFWEKIKEQFEDRTVRLLLIAAFVSFVTSFSGTYRFIPGGDAHDIVPPWVEPVIIIVIIIGNGCMGIYQDYSAEKATEALKQMQSEFARVKRDGEWKIINSSELVPGDVIGLESGTKAPADARVVKLLSLMLTTNESSLTGENKDMNKQPGVVTDREKTGDFNLVFSASIVTNGSAVAVVCYTGMNTATGEIQKESLEAKKDTEDEKTPLGQKLDQFGIFLEKSIFYVCIMIWAMNFFNFNDPLLGGWIKGCLYYFKIAVALAVAAIPEGLPAVITTCLALGTRRLTAQNAIIRKLASVETLGCTTVICSDKTGTITLNKMTVTEMVLFGKNPTDFVNSSWDAFSEGSTDPKVKNSKIIGDVSAGLILNSTVSEIEGTTSGTATEVAIYNFVHQLGKTVEPNSKDYLKSIRSDWDIKNVLSFDSRRKAMSVLVRKNKSQDNLLFTKGASEKIISNSKSVLLSDGNEVPLDKKQKDAIESVIDELGKKGLRVIAFAQKKDVGVLKNFNGIDDTKHPGFELMKNIDNYGDIETGLTLVGLLGIKDPVRKEVPQSMDLCRQAGIVVFMITGDSIETAAAIGKEVKLLSGDEDKKEFCLSGFKLDDISDDNLKATMRKAIDGKRGMVFGRITPKQKRRIVKLLKDLGEVVAMTGDGTNDAPALRQADIGIAMGITGTDAAKEAASMILLDDNFATIVRAVEEGRGIYENMKVSCFLTE
jgi:Ca2+-transporting ATPase